MEKKIELYPRIFLINKKYKKNEYWHYFQVPDVAILIPIINTKFLIVSQKREAINKINFEFPCGWVDLNEKPKKSAARELFEETGYKSLDTLKKLIKFYEEPGRMNSTAHCFFSKKLIKIKNPENGIKIHLFTKNEIINLIRKNKFNNGTHIAAFYKYLSLNNTNNSQNSKN
jgi:ADP-ribose pyrophosphatase YjhB (NUDIX family)